MAASRRRPARPPAAAPPTLAAAALPAPAAGDHPAVRPAPDGGTLLSVRVIPRASRAALDGWAADTLRVRLTAPPVDGAANAALIALLADRLGLPKSAIALVSGATTRQKIVHLHGLTPAETRARLAASPSPSGRGPG